MSTQYQKQKLKWKEQGKKEASEEVIEEIDKYFSERIEYCKLPNTKLNEALRFMYIQDLINIKKELSKLQDGKQEVSHSTRDVRGERKE
jgi:hypothetical protein